MAAQFFGLDGIEIKAMSIYECSKARHPAAQGLCKIRVSSHGFVLEPRGNQAGGVWPASRGSSKEGFATAPKQAGQTVLMGWMESEFVSLVAIGGAAIGEGFSGFGNK